MLGGGGGGRSVARHARLRGGDWVVGVGGVEHLHLKGVDDVLCGLMLVRRVGGDCARSSSSSSRGCGLGSGAVVALVRRFMLKFFDNFVEGRLVVRCDLNVTKCDTMQCCGFFHGRGGRGGGGRI